MSQVRKSKFDPKLLQLRPPYAGRGFVQKRERYLIPEPQDLLHLVQRDHSEYPP